ncbi:multiple resistance and pH regulation protein F [Thioalkalivibrio sp. K90mix]|uniref:cation:proton antiporter n=1 Tax=unclassified Thioalkalivibrio TaxID=2621013 RepID=UPI000195A87B|nr:MULTISPECIES: cation:proton antiporter [unclassified Thioalkalivibrio]ADC71268.1 multiple resistance and pH regulation protein F [Thioalkalivibrio sp. K90mix]
MFEIAIIVANVLLSISLVLGFWRLYLGPTLPDRVVALELIASLTIGFIAVYVIASGRTPFIDVAMVLALTAFLAAVGFARYLEKGGHREDD